MPKVADGIAPEEMPVWIFVASTGIVAVSSVVAVHPPASSFAVYPAYAAARLEPLAVSAFLQPGPR